MDQAGHLLYRANGLYARANETSTANDKHKERPPVYKAIGISLAIGSGVFIGISFVLKKTGLLRANVKYNEEAGEGYGYLKNAFWWSGMTLMILGEICNFVAYSFTDAILVTPLGALSVVITAILSSMFLKERLSFVGKVGCFMCIVGSVVIVMNAPEQSSVTTIQEMKSFVIAPGFLSYAGVIIVACAFIAFWVGPRYGKKSMLVYLSICSLIGGLSVVATQGLGAAVVTQIGGTPQFNQWFLYFLLVFVVATLLTEIIFLNVSPDPLPSTRYPLTMLVSQKALNLFNAALVTPTYYVFFTSSTIVSSAILFRGFKGTVTSIVTVVLGFFQICSGVVLLQLSKSAKDVPDTAVFKGDLDQVRTVAEQEEPESEPKADAIRGTAAIIRRISQSRQKNEAAEAKRIHEEKMREQMEPIGEDEQYEWDGLRRRRTTYNASTGSVQKRKTIHPPLGMAHFPVEATLEDGEHDDQEGSHFDGGFFNSFRRQASRKFATRKNKSLSTGTPGLTEIPKSDELPPTAQVLGAMEMDHVYGLPPSLRDGEGAADDHPSTGYTGAHSKPVAWAPDTHQRPSSSRPNLAPTPPPHANKRQFSFQNPFSRTPKHDPMPTTSSESVPRPSSLRLGLGSRGSSKEHAMPGIKSATEEERMGLVKGDSRNVVRGSDEASEPSDEDEWQLEGKPVSPGSPVGHVPLVQQEEEELPRAYKEWEGRPGGGGSSAGGSRGSGPAFI
ncbi:hypothetical protein MMC21_008235 [Puttea exsequens]|nr:hypothetical protein [Puttea exsequens]